MKLSIPLIYLSLLLLASCQGQKSKNTSSDTSAGNTEIIEDNTFCTEHNKDCGKFAMEMNMNLDEYHNWFILYQNAIETEDEMTDANGDIVDPNASSIESSSRETQKQWVNCKYCHGNGTVTCEKCGGSRTSSCTECFGDGLATSMSGEYRCNLCHGSGIDKCNRCNGRGVEGNCRHCNGRGQVLVTY
jgi:hypothetical protein